jgi:FKBP-type peptidyl-prolyl cis-trans isomerase (trigger factor)
MVAKMVNPGQLTMALIEDILQSSIQSILKDHADISWIGQPYSLNTSLFDVTEGDCVLTYILDYFPTAIQQDTKRETLKPIAHDSTVSDADINNTIQSLLSSYATYEDAESISETTMVRVKATYASETGEDLSSYTKLWYINAEELVSSPGLLKALTGAKAGETITVAYSDVTGIDGLIPKKITTTPDTVSLEIIDLKTKVLPALTQEFIETTFKGEEGIVSEETLRAKITETLSTNKTKSGVMDAVNAYTTAVLPSFSVIIPQTIEDEEYKNRLEQLKEHFQGEK